MAPRRQSRAGGAMSRTASEREDASGATGAADAASGGARLHAKSFKLRFATQHELGRSDVSAVKPLGLPSVVRGKEEARAAPGVPEERVQSALRRVQAMFGAGPRERLAAPVTTAHEYGWWWERGARLEAASRRDPRLRHHIRDSAWLKERLRVLAADDGLQRR